MKKQSRAVVIVPINSSPRVAPLKLKVRPVRAFRLLEPSLSTRHGARHSLPPLVVPHAFLPPSQLRLLQTKLLRVALLARSAQLLSSGGKGERKCAE